MSSFCLEQHRITLKNLEICGQFWQLSNLEVTVITKSGPLEKLKWPNIASSGINLLLVDSKES